ncbi:MAG: hypothetical protein ABI823_14420 [Bryobacteraceae bacterium]
MTRVNWGRSIPVRAAIVWLAALGLGAFAQAQSSGQRIALTYSAASIVNAASNVPGPLAASTFVSIYGAQLSNVTRALSFDDIHGNVLPTTLIGTGLRVLVNAVPANVFYVSPSQINFLMPSNLNPGTAEIQVVVDGHAGVSAFLAVAAASPAFFQLDAVTIIGTHADATLVDKQSPALPGEIVVLYATGLGQTVPPTPYSQIPRGAGPLADIASFRVVLDGVELDPARVAYAGIAPGFAGLFQINVRLPDTLGEDPEIRVRASGQLSPPGLHLPARTSQLSSSSAR